MNPIKKTGFTLILAAILGCISPTVFADTTVISTGRAPYFHTGKGPVASVFYWIGDVVVLPFRVVGDLLS